MKHIIILLLAALATSCITISNYKTNAINNAEPACKTPEYVLTLAKTAIELGNDLSLYSLTKWAKITYGTDVSIQNITYQDKAGKHITAVFDVVRCKPPEN